MNSIIIVQSRFRLITFLILCSAFTNTYGITVANKGLAEAVIVSDKDADEPEKHAAKELADFLGQVTGAKFEVTNEPSAAKNNIFVGAEMAKTVAPDFTTDGLGTDGIVIRTVGDDLILAGGKPRGTLYAVYTFLEDSIGCRWWTSTASTIPHKTTLKVENLNITYVPVFEYRDVYTPDSIDPDWSVRNKRFGIAPGARYRDAAPPRGGAAQMWPTHHSFFIVLPPEKYFDEHPEWYSLIDGKRTAMPSDHASLCLTNEEMRQQYIINMIEEIQKEPTALYASIGAPDDSGPPNLCQCANCLALETAPNPPSELLVRFANPVAAGFSEAYPNVSVYLVAYHQYRKPPVHTRPIDNIIVKLCGIENSNSVSITHKRNSMFRDDLFGWLKISEKVHIYNYIINFSYEFLPYPNLRALGTDMKFFSENGITGVFSEGGIGYKGRTAGYGMEFIRTWMLAKLMWNPNLNPRDLIEEFVDGYYGASGKYILNYIDVMHDAVEASGDWLGIGEPTAVPDVKFLSIETLAKSWTQLKAAEASVKDDKVLQSRVQSLQLSVLYTFMVRWQELRFAVMCRGIEWPIDESIQVVYNHFMKVTEDNKIGVNPRTQAELTKALQTNATSTTGQASVTDTNN